MSGQVEKRGGSHFAEVEAEVRVQRIDAEVEEDATEEQSDEGVIVQGVTHGATSRGRVDTSATVIHGDAFPEGHSAGKTEHGTTDRGRVDTATTVIHGAHDKPLPDFSGDVNHGGK